VPVSVDVHAVPSLRPVVAALRVVRAVIPPHRSNAHQAGGVVLRSCPPRAPAARSGGSKHGRLAGRADDHGSGSPVPVIAESQRAGRLAD